MFGRKLFGILTLAVMPVSMAQADVKLHPLFTDNMVLQREMKLPVWGTATPGEAVTVMLTHSQKDAVLAKGTAKADAEGMWKVELPAQKDAGDGYMLTIAGKDKVTLKNVAIGDVWLCSGQSNMEWKVRQLGKNDQAKKVAEAATNPMIRLFDVPNRPFPTPQKDFPQNPQTNSGVWVSCTPETVINFSAVGYFFGKEIQASQKVPVGLIASDWGGTPAEAWTTREGLSKHPELKYYLDRLDSLTANPEKIEKDYQTALANWKKAADKAKVEGKPAPRQPRKPVNGGVNQNVGTALYNGMIEPLLPFPIKGAIWYQGESNASRAYEYRTLFPAMIESWREKWGYEFPFYAVQLAPFRGGASGVDYAELRDAQYFATKKLKNVGIAIITDVGDETDIHPQQKGPVGMRLALEARANTYGEKIEFRGPEFKSVKFDGGQAIVTFDYVGGGLMSQGDELTGFQICGADHKFHPAVAKIDGDKVILSCEAVEKPTAVRYGWVNFAKPMLNFFNKAGLPAVPFRTDDLPFTTAPKK